MQIQNISVDSSDNIYATSYASAFSPTRMLVVKYNSSGVIQLQRIFGASAGASGISLALNAISADGKLILYGVGQQSSAYIGEILRVPNDGTLTGTYTVGAVTSVYSVSTFTESDVSGIVTQANASLTEAAGSMTVSASSLASTALTLTNTVTGI